MKQILMLLIAVSLAGAFAAAPAGTAPAEQQGTVRSIDLPAMTFDLAAGPDRDKVNAFCAICHGTEYIPMQPKLSKAQWTGTVTKMIKVFGAPVPQEDADMIVNYLSTAYGTGN